MHRTHTCASEQEISSTMMDGHGGPSRALETSQISNMYTHGTCWVGASRNSKLGSKFSWSSREKDTQTHATHFFCVCVGVPNTPATPLVHPLPNACAMRNVKHKAEEMRSCCATAEVQDESSSSSSRGSQQSIVKSRCLYDSVVVLFNAFQVFILGLTTRATRQNFGSLKFVNF